MKTKISLYLAVMGAVGMLASCSSDSPEVPGSVLESKTYTTTGQTLVITVDGQAPADAMTAEFAPTAEGTANITVKTDEMPINGFLGDMGSALPEIKVPASTFIPGATTFTIPVTLEGTEDTCTFTGNAETEYCTYAYNGTVSADTLNLNVSDIKLKNTSMAGTYNMPAWNNDIPSILRINWQSSKKVPSMFGEMPISTLLSLSLAMVQVDVAGEKVAAAEALTKVLKSVTFGEDGSVTARYLDTEAETPAETTSPKGLARYVVKDDNTILLFLDPAAIAVANADVPKKAKTRADLDIDALLNQVMTEIVPMISNGLPIHYGKSIKLDENGENPTEIDDPNIVSFYLGTEILLPILKMAAPILSDPDMIDAIVNIASQDPTMGGMASMMLPGMLQALPEIIDQTTTVEIGINLTK